MTERSSGHNSLSRMNVDSLTSSDQSENLCSPVTEPEPGAALNLNCLLQSQNRFDTEHYIH